MASNEILLSNNATGDQRVQLLRGADGACILRTNGYDLPMGPETDAETVASAAADLGVTVAELTAVLDSEVA